MSPYEEILHIIRNAPGPIGSADIYDKCKSIETIGDVSSRLKQLLDKGKVVREEITTANNRKGFAYSLPNPDAAPADPDAGRPTAGIPLTGIRPMDTPTLGDPGISLGGAAGKTKRAKPVKPNADHVAAAGKVIESSAEDLADAILAKTKRLFAPMPIELATTSEPLQVHIHIHIEQVDFHLGGL